MNAMTVLQGLSAGVVKGIFSRVEIEPGFVDGVNVDVRKALFLDDKQEMFYEKILKVLSAKCEWHYDGLYYEFIGEGISVRIREN